MSVIAKFNCCEIAEYVIGKKVTLVPVTGECEENKTFFKWTPSGKIEMSILNPEAAEQFEIGKNYYVEFVKE